MNPLPIDSSFANFNFFCMNKNPRRNVQTTTHENVFQQPDNDLKLLITVELTTFNAQQRVSTNAKISPHAERRLSQKSL